VGDGHTRRLHQEDFDGIVDVVGSRAVMLTELAA
jgi:hypothetical protein